MPKKEAVEMLVMDHFCSSLKNDIACEKNFLNLNITTARTKVTIEPPKKEWRKP
jgi:hypothetical protein